MARRRIWRNGTAPRWSAIWARRARGEGCSFFPLPQGERDVIALRQLGHQLHEFLRRPGAGGTGVHVALHAERHRELDHVVAVRRLDHDDEIGVAGGHIDLLDLDAHFFARSRAACARLGASLIPRMPWSVKFNDKMNIMMVLPGA